MRWKQGRRSENVEDRRGKRVAKTAGVGLGGLLLVVIAGLMTGDTKAILESLLASAGSLAEAGAGADGSTSSGSMRSPEEDELADFVSVVLANTEDVWSEQFTRMGRRYAAPKLVLFTDEVRSACGMQSAAVGPFYCPADESAYIDLGFYKELRDQLGAPGDFAQAYVLAHEVGHHIQNLLGDSAEVHRAQQGLGQAEANELSVRLELQADFYAGVWAHHSGRAGEVYLEEGDVEEALTAAAHIGDDYLQKRAGRRVAPESFTHGTSEQRMRWFGLGMQTGDPSQGDTFSARRL